ncbi:MAG: methylmalonyl-CoA mutase family protein [Bacteroidota bacterium]
MPPIEPLFSDFHSTNKEQWLDKVTADLKGKGLDTLDWQLEEQIRLSAINAPADQPAATPPILDQRAANTWQIGEYIEVKDLGAANAQALEGLVGGVNAPLFIHHHLPTLEELEMLLRDIEPGFISVHFAPAYPGKDPAELFRNLIYYTRRRGLDLAKIKGSMDFDPLLDWVEPPFKPLARILAFAANHTPNFRVLQVNGRQLHSGITNTTHELALIVAKGVDYLAKLSEHGIAPLTTNAHLQFSVALNTSYFVAIAKLRALKILWANALAGFGLEEAPIPPISAHLAMETQTTEREYNMIKAATQAMSAVVGGADLVYITPSDYQITGDSTSFSRRIARNAQHLLQLESHLDQVVDPAAGSYFIENLTRELANEAWQQFQQIERKGGYSQIVHL